ncbi:MAG TPA: cyclopropane-fatty-acyl-phospholipid synthase family protein [Burkholderiales bacterium]
MTHTAASLPSRLPLAARPVLAALERLAHGRLRMTLPDGARLDFGPGGPQAAIELRDARAFGRILRGGDIGFAEGYLEGEWDTPDLAALLGVLAANREALAGALHGSLAGRLAQRLLNLLRANTRAGSRRNIAAHYDLGNDFYALWLDAGMSYSSGLYQGDPSRSLADAQQAKYEHLLGLLDLPAGRRVLEIGCGWGGFAELAAARGLEVTGISLSRRQLEWAERRLAGRGFATGSSLAFLDYRDVRGRFDAVASIEMLEAVGERWWPSYFAKLAEVLPRGGRAAIQSILIDASLFETYRRGGDFIRRYIFPGGMLPTMTRIEQAAGRAGFEVAKTLRFGQDYATTLVAWRERFLARRAEVRALGYDERFLRMWNFYLAYCEAGFRAGSTDVAQVLLVKR